MTTLLVTGGAGFIGSNLLRWLLQHRPAYRLACFDALTYAGSLANLEGVLGDPRHTFLHADVRDRRALDSAIDEVKPDAILHLAAESHVDRSIGMPSDFVTTNVVGTTNVLDSARSRGVSRVVVVSTDEVYGSLGPTGKFTETTPLDPTSPYSASKAAADVIALAYARTLELDVVVTRCSNNYGPYQFPEKLIPLMILRALDHEPLPVYGDGKNVRDWVHVDDHCQGIVLALEKGQKGRVYNLGGDAERENIQIVHQILDRLEKTHDLIRYVRDRPAHDFRYAMDSSRARAEFGFAPCWEFEQGLRHTIDWYVGNSRWLMRIKDARFRTYFAENYAQRLDEAS